MKEISIKTETFIAMYIIAMGEWNGIQWELFPKLPNCFTQNLNFQSSCGCNADFLRLTVNDLFGVEFWFADEDDDTFYYSFNEIVKSHPLLIASIITYIDIMIDNFKDC